MQHPNISSHSLTENLYDISIGKESTSKRRYTPRRVGSLSSLSNLNDQKRPSVYYLNKLSQSSVHLPKQNPNRPNSEASVSSCDTSKDSDDASSVHSTPFDCPDSRLSSMTTNTVYSNRLTEGSEFETLAKGPVGPISENEVDEEMDQMSSSISTITLKNDADLSGSSASALQNSNFAQPILKLRSVSTSSVLETKSKYNQHMPKLSRQNTNASTFSLTRTKTRYYNAKETKERMQLRKKLYEENDDDDILSNDLDLVFNVPIIKNHGDIYRTHRSESVPNMLSRHDIVKAENHKYPYKPTETMKPCPLPGNLSRSTLSIDRLPHSTSESHDVTQESIVEEDEKGNSSFYSYENDSQICQNISDYYTDRSLSFSKIAKLSRDQQLMNKLPNFVKSHSSVEDISLISPEKLEVVDQSRPINLPPKTVSDKSKHNREMKRVLNDFENCAKNRSELRNNLGKSFIINQQNWLCLMITNEGKEFEHKLNSDRDALRKLNWESIIPDRLRYDYFLRVLSLDLAPGFVDETTKTFSLLEHKYERLSDQMRASKDAEFNRLIGQVLERPIFRNFFVQLAETQNAVFDKEVFHANYKHLLYLKSLSDGGLSKHHEIFVIPVFLMLFQSSHCISDIHLLMELFDKSVFDLETFDMLNKKLSKWTNLSSMSYSSPVYKSLSKFTNLDEFEYLNSTTLFELIIQLNDRLPLSLSAPSTPVVAQSTFSPLAKASFESERGSKTSSANSLENLAESYTGSICKESSSISLVEVLLQLLVIYSRSKNKQQNYIRIYQGFLLTIFKYYHINWDNCGELVKSNKSIKLNNSYDQVMNLESFLDKWKRIFKKM